MKLPEEIIAEASTATVLCTGCDQQVKIIYRTMPKGGPGRWRCVSCIDEGKAWDTVPGQKGPRR